MGLLLGWLVHHVCSYDHGGMLCADFGLARIFQSPVRPLSDVERVVATLAKPMLARSASEQALDVGGF